MSKVSVQGKTGKHIAVEVGERIYVGVDVHKHTFSVALHSAERGCIVTWVQPADDTVLRRRLKPLREQIQWVVYEAGPTGFSLVRALRKNGYCADVIAPSKMLAPVCAGDKSDRLDCRKLAEFAAKGLLTKVEVPGLQQEGDRQILRLREQVRKKVTVSKQQIKSFLLQHGIREPNGLTHWTAASVAELRGLELSEELRFCLDVHLDELQHAQQQLKRVTGRVEQLAESKRYKSAVQLLESVGGVGLITAMVFLTELISPERFKDGREVARMLGLAPQVRQSGLTRQEGGLLKTGNRRIRTVLVEAAWRWVAQDKKAQERYRRLIGNTGDSKKAIVGMARHLGILLWRMVTRGEMYRGTTATAA